MGMGNYDLYDQPDPDEERKRQEDAFAALAAAGGAAQPELAPPPPPVELPPPDLSLLRNPALNDELPGAEPVEIPGAIPDLPDPSVEGRAFSALAAKPHDGWESEFAAAPDPTESAVSALAGASAPRAPEPAEGASSAFRSPTSQDSPVPGQIKEAPPESAPSQPPPPMAAAEPPAQPDPLEALMRRGEEQRTKQLADYDKEGAPGVNGWALLADVAFNKGRSIPGILQQADADKRHYQEGRQKLLTGGAHGDPVNQMLAMERIRTGQGNLTARTDGAAARGEALRKEGEADVLAGDRFRQYAQDKGFYDPSMEGLGGKALAKQFPMRREDKTLALAPELNKAAGDKTAAVTHARNATNAEDAPLLEDVSYARGSGNFRAQAEYAPDKPLTPKEQGDVAAREEQLKLARGREAREIANRGEDNTRKDASEETAFNMTYSDKTKGAVKVAQSLGPLQDDLAKNASLFGLENNPVEGMLPESWVNKIHGLQAAAAKDPAKKAELEKAIQFRTNYNELSQFALLEATGLASNLNEQEKTAIRTGSKPDATLAEMQAGLKTIERGVKSTISRYGSPRPEWASKNLKVSGLDPSRWAPDLQPSPSTAPSSTPAPGGDEIPAGNEGFDPMGMVNPEDVHKIDSSASTLGSPQKLPPKAAARALADTGKPTFKVTVTLPNGRSFDEDAATSEELKMLETSMGARIQVRQ